MPVYGAGRPMDNVDCPIRFGGILQLFFAIEVTQLSSFSSFRWSSIHAFVFVLSKQIADAFIE